MSLRNLQNLHCTIWLRVVDVIFVYLFLSFTTWSTGTLLGFLVERFSVGGQFSEFFVQFSRGSLGTVISRGSNRQVIR